MFHTIVLLFCQGIMLLLALLHFNVCAKEHKELKSSMKREDEDTFTNISIWSKLTLVETHII